MSRIAVIGSGISGLAAAWLLSRRHEVHLFEKESRLGGHTHTHHIETSRGALPIDTGFIVHNDRTYPNFIKLMAMLGVRRQPSDMSFGVSCERTGLEYSSRGLRGFFANRRRIASWSHYRLFAEIVRFNREAKSLLEDPRAENLTLGEYLRDAKFHPDFARYYLYPMAAAVWSTAMEDIEAFPALTLLRFFDNHGFLGINTHHQWYALQDGSSSYIAPLSLPFRQRIHLDAEITGVHRTATGITLVMSSHPPLYFDEVVFACHAPQALELLLDASREEKSVLGAFLTTRNEALLHTDSTLLPKRADARASWNYHLGADDKTVTLTYHMNRLQSLPTKEDYCVTLNPNGRVHARKILRSIIYNHPLYTLDAVRSQRRWQEISGSRNTHFCGAYWAYGFHEDGLNSAIRVAAQLGVDWGAVSSRPEPLAVGA